MDNNYEYNKDKKVFHNVLGATIFAVILAVGICVGYYVTATDIKSLDSILPLNGESYSFESTVVTDGNIEPVKDVSAMVENVMPSVVAITETSVVQGYSNFFGFYPGQGEVASGSGSGIIVEEDDANYYIVTNNHVVADADKIDVTFVDEKIVQAKVKGNDPDNDLAILTVEKKAVTEETKKKIAVAKMGDSDKVRVGEVAIAIGNSLGYGQSVTVGYIGALNRKLELENGTMEAIQTDAAINPGNSGGALLNIHGDVIGINSAKLAAEEVEGMGYAIPISKAQPILNRLIKKEVVDDVNKGYIGITGRTVNQEEIEVLKYKKGVFVVEVLDDGGAKAAGILPGDIITKVNKEKVSTIEGLISLLGSYKQGETVEVTLYRNSAGELKKKTIKVTLSNKKVVEEEPKFN